MTPKDKAKQLVEMFSNVKRPMLKGYNISVNMHPEHAKQCALICVDELIELYNFENPNRGFKVSYWDEVKQEINKL